MATLQTLLGTSNGTHSACSDESTVPDMYAL